VNSHLLSIVRDIIEKEGEAILSDPKRMKAIFGDMATGVDRLDRKALGGCIEKGAYFALKYAITKEERVAKKTALAVDVGAATGADMQKCLAALDVLEAAMFGAHTEVPVQAEDLPRPQEPNSFRGQDRSVTSKPPKAMGSDTGRDRSGLIPQRMGTVGTRAIDTEELADLRKSHNRWLVGAVCALALLAGPVAIIGGALAVLGVVAVAAAGVLLYRSRCAIGTMSAGVAQSRLMIAKRWIGAVVAVGALWVVAVAAYEGKDGCIYRLLDGGLLSVIEGRGSRMSRECMGLH